MYNCDALKDTLRDLFYNEIGNFYDEDWISEYLDEMDFPILLQAVRHHAHTVYTYITQDITQDSQTHALNYRGSDLFGQRATFLYRKLEQNGSGTAPARRDLELWLLEDMSLSVVSCVTVDCGNGAFFTQYRERKGDFRDNHLCLDLTTLMEILDEMCLSVLEGSIPVYEL